MDALIMSCSTGGGHNTAALAVKEELLRRGHAVTTLDPYELAHRGLDQKVGNFYIRMVQRMPSMFGLAYRLGEMYRHLPGHSPVYWVNGKMCGLMEEYLKQHHFDVILTTHLFPGEILTYMKNRGISVPKTVFVATDYTCIPFTEEIDCDYYIVPSKALADDFTSRGIDPRRVVPAGIPVKRAFAREADREMLLDELGLDHGKRYLLLSGGSMGAGRIRGMVGTMKKYLENHPEQVLIVVCGNNDRLYERLEAAHGGDPQILLLHKTDRMAEYMKVSDVFISKPGGLSSTEAAASRVPLIHISPIPGCEEKNMDFFSRNGMSVEVEDEKKELIPALRQLQDAETVEEMREHQREQVNPFAAAQICELLEHMVESVNR